MKKALLIAGGVFIALAIIGNIVRTIGKPVKTTNTDPFAAQIEKANQSCPIPVAGGAGYVSAIKLEDNNVTYYIHYNEKNNNPMLSEKNQDNFKEMLVMALLCMNGQEYGQGDFLISELINEGYGLKVVYTDATGKKTESVASVSELKTMKEKFHLNPHEALHKILEMEVEAERASLPLKIEDGMFITNYGLDRENIIITISLDENMYSLSEVKKQKDYLKMSILQEGLQDYETKALLDLCKVSHTGLVYRMTGNHSKKHCDIIITSDEIRKTVPVPSSISIN